MKPGDTIENLLERLNCTREELLSIERSMERIFAAEQRNGSGKTRPRKVKIESYAAESTKPL